MKIQSAIAAALVMLAGAVQADGKLVVYNWAEYIPDGVLADFEKEKFIKL